MRYRLTGFMSHPLPNAPILEIDANPFSFALVEPDPIGAPGNYELIGVGLFALGKAKLFIQETYSSESNPWTAIVDLIASEPNKILIQTVTPIDGNKSGLLNKSPFELIFDYEPES